MNSDAQLQIDNVGTFSYNISYTLNNLSSAVLNISDTVSSGIECDTAAETPRSHASSPRSAAT